MDALNINTIFEMINFYDYLSNPKGFENYEEDNEENASIATQSDIDAFFS